MPTLFDFVRAEKTNVDIGSWHSGHINRSAFPLSKAKAKNYKFGPEYKWRVVRFDSLGVGCRILIIFNDSKLICRSVFAVEAQNDLVVLCSHEYHADHPGWHCHLTLDDHDKALPGVFRTAHRRWPQARSVHARTQYGITQASALTHVAARYRFQAQTALEL